MNLGNFFSASSAAAQNGVGNGTVITVGTISYDADGQFASNTFTVTAAGLWLFGCYVAINGIVDGNQAGVSLVLGGTSQGSSAIAGGTTFNTPTVFPPLLLAANNTVTIQTLTAANINISAANFWGFRLA